jgi:crotonobetainyl-CoA:carnitine CoA-transferase CaiB-like acyl-CoA transferase
MNEPAHVIGAPLRGLRLVSLADEALPWMTKCFVDFGADVELLHRGGLDGPAQAPRDLLMTRGKRVTRLADDPAVARTQVSERLAEADALVISPRTMAAAGFTSPSEIADEHPHLVIAVRSAFGLTGDRADWVGSEAVFQALGGNLSRSGEPGHSPLLPPGKLFARSAAHEIAWTVLAAVFQTVSRSDGRGAVLDCSVFEAGAASFDPAYGMQGSGTPDTLEAYGRPDTARIYPIIKVRDGYVRVLLLAKGQWLAMRSWMGDPEPLLGDELLTNPGRWANADLIVPMVADFLASMTCDEVVRECRERRIPAAHVLRLAEALEEEHYHFQGVFTEIGQIDGKPVVTAEGMATVDGRRAVPLDPAPREAQPRAEWAPSDVRGPYPLSGITVLDVGVIVAGATVGQLFAQLGARVIRIENQQFPDGMRRSYDWSTPSQARGHRGKESVGLDLRTDEGRRIFHDLARQADVVSSNFKPGTVEKLGISYADLAQVNPRLVCVESSAFGTTGPWRTAMGYGPLVRAASGQSWLWREGPEAEYFGDGLTLFPDHLIGRICAFAAVAGVLDARRTGRGGHIVVPQSDAGLVFHDEHLAEEYLNPGSVLPPGNRENHLLSQVLFPAAGNDQWCVVDPQTADQLSAVRGVVGASGEDDPTEIVAAYVRDRDPGAVANQMQSVGVPAARMLRVAEIPEDPAIRSRDWYQTTSVAGTDEEVLVERCSVLSAQLTIPDLAPMPMFGAHTRSVLAEIGRSPEEIEELVTSGIAQEHGASRA